SLKKKKKKKKFMGPYIINNILNFEVYKLKNLNGKKEKNQFNSDRLKLYHDRKIKDLPVPQIIIIKTLIQVVNHITKIFINIPFVPKFSLKFSVPRNPFIIL